MSTNLNDDELTAEDLAAIEQMQKATPDQTANAGEGEPPAPAPDQQQQTPPEQKATDGDDDDDEDDTDEITIDSQGNHHGAKGQFVSKKAYLRVKEQRKAERDNNRQLHDRVIKGEERLATLLEIINSAPEDGTQPNGQAPQQQAADPNPFDEADIDEIIDPVGAMKQMKARTAYVLKQNQALQRQMQEGQQSASLQTAEMRLVEAYKRDSQAFYQKEPAFKDAWGHFLGMRHAQLEAVGIADKGQRDEIIAQEERSIVHKAFAEKRSPAEAIYKFCLASGFKPQAKPNGQGNGQPQQTPAAQKIAQQAANMQKTQSLSSAGGAGIPENGAFQRLMAMSDEEFYDFSKTPEGIATLRKHGLV